MAVRVISAVIFLIQCIAVTVAGAYVPLLDEVEGVNGNNGHYLILPAWENLDSAQRQKAYFIIPKVVVIAGNADKEQPEYQFGVSHRGFTLFANGTADYPPSIDLLATVTLLHEDKAIDAIRKDLTKRDTAQGLEPPVFPDPTFEKWEGSVAVAGVASSTALAPITGGYPGSLTPLHVVTPTDAIPSLILDLPGTAGRDASVWGVSMTGTVPGYANRLKCEITVHHKKVYEHFKARASGQAYWGLLKGDLAKEVKSMDQDQSIDFGKCRGSADQIEKIVMPVWNKITTLTDQDGNKMFADMIKGLDGIPGHPEAATGGWGFQASAGWESVKYTDQTKINFDISFRGTWQLPLGVRFSTTCTKWKRYFINATNQTQPCVDSSDFPAIRAKTRACYKEFLDKIEEYPSDVRPTARKRLSVMGCAWDGSFGSVAYTVQDLSATESRAGRACRKQYLDLISSWEREKKIASTEGNLLKTDIGFYGCNWRPSTLQQLENAASFNEEFSKVKESLNQSLLQ